MLLRVFPRIWRKTSDILCVLEYLFDFYWSIVYALQVSSPLFQAQTTTLVVLKTLIVLKPLAFGDARVVRF